MPLPVINSVLQSYSQVYGPRVYPFRCKSCYRHLHMGFTSNVSKSLKYRCRACIDRNRRRAIARLRHVQWRRRHGLNPLPQRLHAWSSSFLNA